MVVGIVGGYVGDGAAGGDGEIVGRVDGASAGKGEAAETEGRAFGHSGFEHLKFHVGCVVGGVVRHGCGCAFSGRA